MMIRKTTRVFQLAEEIQEQIIDDVKKALDMSAFLDVIDEAIESRLCDLEDLINIDKYLV